jgi:hypothetical protein
MNNYTETVGSVIRSIGSGEDWNTRFKLSLDLAGLKLSTTYINNTAYPQGVPYQAPTPFGSVDAWEVPSYIVYKENV